MRNGWCAAVFAVVLISLTSFSFRPTKSEIVDILPSEEVSTFSAEKHPEVIGQDEKAKFTPIDIPLSDELQLYAYELCIQSDPPIPFEMVIAIIEHESNFNANAVGHNTNGTSDYGLMQINSCTMPLMQELFDIQTEEELLNSKVNLQAGIYILSMHMDEFEMNLSSVLMAYQCGASGAEEMLTSGIKDTAFSRNILIRMKELEKRNKI